MPLFTANPFDHDVGEYGDLRRPRRGKWAAVLVPEKPGGERRGGAALDSGGQPRSVSGQATSYLSEIGVPIRAVLVTQSRSGEKAGSLEAQVADTNFLISPELVNTLPLGRKCSGGHPAA